jgi:aspartyl protease family protein
MLLIAWLVAMGLATWLFGTWQEGRDNPNRAPESLHGEGYIEVRLASSRGGHYLLDGTINSRGARFLLDTGATHVAIPKALAQSLQLERGSPIQVNTANGSATGWRTRLASLQLGDIQLHDVAAIIVPNMDGDEVLLGMSALKQLEFTQRDGSLVLRQNTRSVKTAE